MLEIGSTNKSCKTKYYTNGPDEKDGIRIKVTGNFTCLVSIIDEDGYSDMEIMKRVSTGKKSNKNVKWFTLEQEYH